jgi:cytoplasmic iron level regulating protein YaaA (DUF328/UPF0246 family)
MGTKLSVDGYKSLYEFWSEKIAVALNKDFDDQIQHSSTQPEKLLVNIASQEYFKAISLKHLDKDINVIECIFKDHGKVISVYAKRARGLMARYIICRDPSDKSDFILYLQQFNYENYVFVYQESTDTKLVFNRTVKYILAKEIDEKECGVQDNDDKWEKNKSCKRHRAKDSVEVPN